MLFSWYDHDYDHHDVHAPLAPVVKKINGPSSVIFFTFFICSVY